MKISKHESTFFHFSVEINDQEAGRARLFIITNKLHSQPYGLLEDVYVDESAREQGVGTNLVSAAIAKAKELHCYKILATSRDARTKVHGLYKDLGFIQHGLEFRMNL